MTKEEALNDWLLFICKMAKGIKVYEEALDIIIKVLQKESCDDVVSRQAALNSLMDNTHLEGYDLAEALDAIENTDKLPSVQPQPCEDCISREEMWMAYHKMIDSGKTVDVYDAIKNLPPVTPIPKMGRWLPIEYDGYADGFPVWNKWECSECGYEHNGDEESLTAFCPNCGQKMEV